VQQKSLSSIVWQGVIVEVLNPKTVLFFALFLPPFLVASDVSPVESNVTMQLLVLGALVPLTAIPCDLMVAYMGGTMTQAINRKRVMRERMTWAGGLILIVIAINLHLQVACAIMASVTDWRRCITQEKIKLAIKASAQRL